MQLTDRQRQCYIASKLGNLSGHELPSVVAMDGRAAACCLHAQFVLICIVYLLLQAQESVACFGQLSSADERPLVWQHQ